MEKDALFIEAAKYIIENQEASTSMLQRKFNLGYGRASKILNELALENIISEPDADFFRRRVLVKDLNELPL